MTDLSALEAYAGQLSEAAVLANASAQTHKQIVNGDAQTDVLTESGLVPSLAKQAVLAQAKVTAALEEVASGLSGAMAFTTTAKGLLATSPGELFGVLSPSNKEYVLIYENVAGAAVPTGKSYPSTAAVDSLAGIISGNLGTEAAYIFPDVNDQTLLWINTAGGIYPAGASVSLQEQIADIELSAPQTLGTGEAAYIFPDKNDITLFHIQADGRAYAAGMTQPIQRDAVVAKSRGNLAIASHFVGDTAAKKALQSDIYRVEGTEPSFAHSLISLVGAGGTKQQRTPGVVETATHGLLVMWGQGYAPYDGDGKGVKLVRQNVQIDLVRNTVTPGATSLFLAPVNASAVVKHPMLGKTLTGRIVLVYDSTDETAVEGEYRTYACYSDDDGQTFSAPVKIAGPTGAITKILTGSTGRIETMPSGRLILPMYGLDNANWFVSCMYSTDNGLTWTLGGKFYDTVNNWYINESSVANDGNGNLIFTVRDEFNNPKSKLLLVSTDGGLTLTTLGHNSDLPSPLCASSMCYSGGKLLHSGPTETVLVTNRSRYRVKISYNAAANFAVGFAPFPETYFVGYSCIIPLAGGGFAVAYEGGPLYGMNSQENIGIFVFNMREVYDNGRHI